MAPNPNSETGFPVLLKILYFITYLLEYPGASRELPGEGYPFRPFRLPYPCNASNNAGAI
jgi:hypothetical protein